MRCLTLLPAIFLSALHAQPGRFGLPACAGPDVELADRPGYLVCYDFTRKLPRWTAHEILPGASPSHRPRFRPDTALSRPTAANRDFRFSGYHRGHLVPAADLAGNQAAYAASFLLSNVMPQPAAINGGVWRRLENAVRRLLSGADGVIVITGTIAPADAARDPGEVTIPTYAYKAVLALAGANKRMYAVLVPNSPAAAAAALPDAATTVDYLEQVTGLDFFAALPDDEERTLESARSTLPGPAR